MELVIGLLHEISILPGRVRLKDANLYYNKPLAKYITVYVDSLHGVKHCDVNYITGTMLIEFESDKTEYGLLKRNIENAIKSAIKNGVEDLARFDAYYKAIEKRDSAKRGFAIWGVFYLLLKIKHFLFGKFSLSSDIRILGIASAVGIIASYPWFNRIYKKLTSRVIKTSDMLLSVTAVLLTVLRESTEGIFVLILRSLNEYVRYSADVKSQRLLNQSMLKTSGMAWIVSNQGQEVLVPLESTAIGDIIIVHKGELIPVEGKVTEGSAIINCTYHTGRPYSSKITKGRIVYDGMTVLSGEIKIKVSRIPETGNKEDISIHNLDINKKVNNYQERIMPYSMGAAAIIYLMTGSILDAMAIMLILAPSGSEVALSTGITSYVSALSKYGIYLRNPNTIEKITATDNVIFDKTGTLTYGRMRIISVKSFDDNYSEKDLLRICAACEINSQHPVAVTLRKIVSKDIDTSKIESTVTIPSQGVKAVYDGRKVLIGNKELMKKSKIPLDNAVDIYADYEERFYTPILVSIDKKISGIIVLQDVIKDDSYEMVDTLKNMGFKNISLLTGDSRRNAEASASEIGICNAYGDCSYQDKAKVIEKNKQYSTVMMVGDGVNDVLAMKTADVSLSFASSSCDRAKLHSDCIVFEDDMNRLPQLIYLSNKSHGMIKQSIAASKLYNIIFGLLDFVLRFDPFTAKTIDTVNSLIVLLLNKRIEYLKPEDTYRCRNIGKTDDNSKSR